MTWTGLIDFSKIKGNAICGLDDKQIEEIVRFQQGITEFDDNSNTLEFDIDRRNDKPQTSSDLDALEEYAVPKSTLYQQKRFSGIFTDFLKAKNYTQDLTLLSKRDVSDILREFYSELRNKDGGYYSPTTLNCIRAAISRYFINILKLDFNIIRDIEFTSPNLILKAMGKKFFEQGGNIKHFDAIENADLTKLSEYFDRSTPEKLQEEVYFIIEYFLGTRGREWIRHLKRRNIMFHTDSNGINFVEIDGLINFQKNHQPSLNCGDRNDKQSRIYATGKTNCPVIAIRLLLSKLPSECDNIFYKKRNDWFTSQSWHNSKLIMGIHTIGNLMKRISINAKLSRVYTSHCIRPTVVSSLFNRGFTAQDIQCVTGHKREDSVKRYMRRVCDAKKMGYSNALSDCITPEIPSTSSNHNVTISESKRLRIETGSTMSETENATNEAKKLRLQTSWGYLEVDL